VELIRGRKDAAFKTEGVELHRNLILIKLNACFRLMTLTFSWLRDTNRSFPSHLRLTRKPLNTKFSWYTVGISLKLAFAFTATVATYCNYFSCFSYFYCSLRLFLILAEVVSASLLILAVLLNCWVLHQFWLLYKVILANFYRFITHIRHCMSLLQWLKSSRSLFFSFFSLKRS